MSVISSIVRDSEGNDVFLNSHIQELRQQNSMYNFIAQDGGQERMLQCFNKIRIVGGSRGGSKTTTLLMENLYDIYNPYFNALIVRNEQNDLENIVKESERMYSQFGTYKRSRTDMTWDFNYGGHLVFGYYGDSSYADFVKRFQGKQYSYIGIDEITQCPYKRFKYLLTDNRNAFHIPNRVVGTCNPDPDSWVRIFIDWWIGDDGYPIHERDGKERFCFMDGDNPSSIIWGDTPDEVYNQCKDTIDALWTNDIASTYEALGFNRQTAFISSVTFVKSSLEDNRKLVESDPSYMANLAQQSEEQRQRDLKGNWNYKASGDDMIKIADMEALFFNSHQLDDNIHYASCDPAFEGGDNLVMWHWIGFHIVDLFVCRADAKTALAMVRQKLLEWGVAEENFTFDLNGIGQSFKGFFPNAVPFNNMAAPIPMEKGEKDSVKYMYANLKSQCAFYLVDKIKKREISIAPDLLTLKYSGDGFEKMPLQQVLLRERKCIRRNTDKADSGFALIQKKVMKKFVGHSPDFFEGLIYRMIFTIQKKKKVIKRTGLWRI